MIIRAIKKQAQSAIVNTRRWANTPAGCSTCGKVRKVVAKVLPKK